MTEHRSDLRRRRRRSRSKRRAGLVGVAAVVVVLGAVYALVLADDGHDHTTVSGDDSTPSPTAGLRTPAPGRDDSGGIVPLEEAVAACNASLAVAAEIVAEAETGVTHWAGHIGARADWLAGRISTDEKAATYKRTRLAGPDDQLRFAAVVTTYEETPGCDGLDRVSVDDAVTRADEIAACRDRADRAAAAIAAGNAAMADWKAHLDAMAEHAEGHMANDEADREWAEASANAPPNIDAFAAARTKWEQAPGCTADSGVDGGAAGAG